MDPTVLKERIRATLDANADVRRQAEIDLKHVSCLVIMEGETSDADDEIGGRIARLPGRASEHSPR